MTDNAHRPRRPLSTPFPEIGKDVDELLAVAMSTMSADQERRAMRYAKETVVRSGEVLVDVGSTNRDLFLCGSATLESMHPNGAEGGVSEVFLRYGARQFAGELNVLTGAGRTLAIRAVSAGVIGTVDPASFRSLMARETDLSDLVLRACLARRRLLRLDTRHTLRVIGTHAAASGFTLVGFLDRNDVPYVWIDRTSPEGRAAIVAAGLGPLDLPAAVTSTATIPRVTPGLIADHLGLTYHQPGRDLHDLVVVGAGPAGLAAAVYGASEGLRTVLLDAVAPGGQAATSARIENFLGFPFGVSGRDLTARALVQALKFGVRVASPCRVATMEQTGEGEEIVLADGTRIRTRAVVVATGARYRSLPIEGWERLSADGVLYAATDLEAASMAGLPVVVVGGANSAGQAALQLRKHNASVTLIVRGTDLGRAMSSYLADRVEADPGIDVRTHSDLISLNGDTKLTSVTWADRRDGSTWHRDCAAVFCFIGAVPETRWAAGVLLDGDGFVRTDAQLLPADLGAAWTGLGPPLPFETSVPGVFAAGDVRAGSLKRVAAAVGEGSSAVRSVHRALQRQRQRVA